MCVYNGQHILDDETPEEMVENDRHYANFFAKRTKEPPSSGRLFHLCFSQGIAYLLSLFKPPHYLRRVPYQNANDSENKP